MQVSKWGSSLAVRLPRALVEELGLKSGGAMEIVSAAPGRIAIAKDECRALAVERMRARAWPIPESYAFDRDEANARSPRSSTPTCRSMPRAPAPGASRPDC